MDLPVPGSRTRVGTEHAALQRISPTVVGLTELDHTAAAPEPSTAEVRAWHAPPAYLFLTAAASHPDIWQAWYDANDAN